jgi:hypothetical protein
MVKPKGNVSAYAPPQCPVCQHPQTRLQRRLTETKNGATMQDGYVGGGVARKDAR